MPRYALPRGTPKGSFRLKKYPDGTYLIRPQSPFNHRVILGRKTGTVCYNNIPFTNPVTLTTPLVGTDTPILRDRT